MERAFAAAYGELTCTAARYLGTRATSLEPSELVHEAFVRIAGNAKGAESKSHLLAIAATAMRQVLVDGHRRLHAEKRGADWHRISLSAVGTNLTASGDVDLEMLERALDELAQRDRRAADVVELRFFGGLTNEQVAEVLDVSRTTVANDWQHARAWLRSQLAVQT